MPDGVRGTRFRNDKTAATVLKRFDSIIVGAGPAGSAAAILLAEAGLSVLLLERSRFPRDKVCGDFVSPRGLRKLAELGCYEEIARRGYVQVRKSLVFLDQEKLSEGDFPHLPGHPAFGHAIPRKELDEIMFRRAQAVGAETIESCEVTGVRVDPDAATVEAIVDRRNIEFRGRIIVGADGASSVVARCANLEMKDPRYIQLAMRSYSRGMPLTDAILYFEEEYFPGFGWVFPVTETTANVGVGMVKESMKKDHIHLRAFYERFVDFVQRLALEQGAHIEISRSAGWPIKTYGGARRNYFDRGLLIGEAGCFVDPISGEGIPLALETAEMAVDTIREALDSGDCSAHALSSYEKRWRTYFDPDLGVSDMVVSMIRNRHLVKLWVQWLRVMGMTAVRDPEYALKTGGILAGLVPNREGFAPDVIFKSLAHGPSFWMEASGMSADTLPIDLVKRGADMLRWELDVARSVLSDADWFRDWTIEILTKQSKVIRNLWDVGLQRTTTDTNES
jgi:geranylgeranyl reductase family protein